MFSNFLKYHFILTTGQEINGRVLAWDDQKILVSTADSPEPLCKVTIYRHAIALTEPVAPGSARARAAAATTAKPSRGC